jgi:hypothetical protein
VKYSLQGQADNEEKMLKWRRCRVILFMVRFKMLLFQEKDAMEKDAGEVDYFR